MTARELLDAYPNARAAVAWTELIICRGSSQDLESSWDLMMKYLPPLNPREVMLLIQSAADDQKDEPGLEAAYAGIRRQMGHPQFLQYVAGKMGAV